VDKSALEVDVSPELDNIECRTRIDTDSADAIIARGTTGSSRMLAQQRGGRVNPVSEWRSPLASVVSAVLLLEIATGVVIFALPFGRFPQTSLIMHTLVGIAMTVPIIWYVLRHWWVRRKGNLSHVQLLGYIAAGLLLICIVSGFAETWQGLFGERISRIWDLIHLISGLSFALFLAAHLATIVVRRINNEESRRALASARHSYYGWSVGGAAAGLCVAWIWAIALDSSELHTAFPAHYNWTFGEDRPFAPSLVRHDVSNWEARLQKDLLDAVGVDIQRSLLGSLTSVEREPMGMFARMHRFLDDVDADSATRARLESIMTDAAHRMRSEGAIAPAQLAGSARCGTCHEEIYHEWLPSAHRYSSMDDMFQRVQSLMAVETSPAHTRYCAGCHDPISLLSGAKNADNVTLSALGADEGISCVVCHSIVQADVQGNGDYTIRPPERYLYELSDDTWGKQVSDFLIRTYPEHHITSYSRPLYKTPEFCGACHKQYVDREVNTDIGKVQGQNQYDSWKNSRWYHGEAHPQTIGCRECHMPLNASRDPARGDLTDTNRSGFDSKHRSHRMLGANQYIPLLHRLEGAEQHVQLVEAWLRGEYPIPEVAHKWTDGPVVRLTIMAPESITPGSDVSLRITLTNNKTGHDFPTGPLDMIESWLEVIIEDQYGNMLHHSGAHDADDNVVGTQVHFKADGFDRDGALIDRHNLWDLVGASYKRSLFAGATDTVQVQLQCPSMARGRLMDGDRSVPAQREDVFHFQTGDDLQAGVLRITAKLWYRKANPEFLDRVYGVDADVRAPATLMSSAEAIIEVRPHAETSHQ